MKHKPYPKYKPSGIDWIGDIPEGWEIRRLRFCLKEPLKYGANEIAIEDDKSLPRYIRITDFDENGLLREDTFRSLPFERAKDYILEDGDILFARSGATVGKTFQFKNYDGQACFAGYLIKASPDEKVIKSDYVYYFTKSIAYENWKNSIFSQATIQNIGADKYQELVISFPKNEHAQIEIINHIEKKTAQMDDLIQKKEEMIKLLKEKRAAIINQAVTKGLDPNAKMKPSGIDWIGHIPEGWQKKRIKFVARINAKALPENTDDNLEFYYIDIGNVSLECGFTKGEKILFSEAPSRARRIVQKGDTIISTVRTYLKAIAYIEDDSEELIASTGFAVISPSDEINEKYFYNTLCSERVVQTISAISTGVSYPAINASEIGDIFIVYPDKQGQEKITDYINKKTAEIDKLIKNVIDAIAKLREYRSSLITAAVTGKIDVREVGV